MGGLWKDSCEIGWDTFAPQCRVNEITTDGLRCLFYTPSCTLTSLGLREEEGKVIERIEKEVVGERAKGGGVQLVLNHHRREMGLWEYVGWREGCI